MLQGKAQTWLLWAWRRDRCARSLPGPCGPMDACGGKEGGRERRGRRAGAPREVGADAPRRAWELPSMHGRAHGAPRPAPAPRRLQDDSDGGEDMEEL